MLSQFLRRMCLISSLLICTLMAPSMIAADMPQAVSLTITPSNVCFIPGLYHDLLHREPDQIELSAGLTYLVTHTRDAYATTLLTNSEYRTGLIRGWYQKFLGRPATNGDIDMWLPIFQMGGTDEQIIASIVSSNEYFNLPRVGATNSGYVTALYHDLLGRSPSSSELSFWLGQMTGGTTRLQVAQSILASAEYRTDLIQGWYQKFLGRAATNNEVSSWLSFFAMGRKDEEIISNIVGSVEYFNRAGICTVDLPLIMR